MSFEPLQALVFVEELDDGKVDHAPSLYLSAARDDMSPELLYPVSHRGEESQANLALIRSREALVRSRTQLINHVRGTVKSFGARLPRCSAESFHKKVAEGLPSELAEALEPIVETIATLTEKIRGYDRAIERLSAKSATHRRRECCARFLE